MVKITVPTVLLVVALLQLVMHCNASEPVHIHLSLDGTTDQRYSKIKNQITHNVNDLSDSSLADIKNTIGKGHIRLYISGDFTQTPPKDDFMKETDLVWDNGIKGAKDIAKIVSKMFKENAIVIVVFPKITQFPCGFEFLEIFEKEIQKTHKDISIGREKIHFYFFLDVEEKAPKIKLFNLPREDDKLISIAANKQLDFYNYASGEWSNGVDSISRVLIYEADTVEIRLESKCDDKTSVLTVAGHTPQSLATELLNAVHAKGQNHPYQTLRLKLPKVCGENVKQRSEFTEVLINILKEKGLDIYGKEPTAVIQFASKPDRDDFPGHAKRKMIGDYKDGNIRQYRAILESNTVWEILKEEKNNGKTEYKLDKIENMKTELSQTKALSIQVHCHGHFDGSKNYICGLDEKTLATKLGVPVSNIQIQIIFYACNVGTEKGQRFVLKFLEKLNGINIQEVISFKSWVLQSGSDPAVLVGMQEKYKATTIIDEKKIDKDAKSLLFNLNDAQIGRLSGRLENYAFGRFTTKVKKISNKYQSFAGLPKTEHNLDNILS